MKAIVRSKYGSPDVLQLQEIADPVPGDNEVLIKVHAVALNYYDWHMLTADVFLIRLMEGFFKPKITILGADVAGQVEAVGNNVTQFKPGDQIFGDIAVCGCGGFAEYVCAREDVLALKPENLSFEEAAAVPMAAITALQSLRDAGQIHPGQKVLINGASGGVGSFAIQIANYFGTEVTAVCSTKNVEMARSLGAHQVIDYAQEDFTCNGRRYDLILAVNGYRSIFEYNRSLQPGGIYVACGGSMRQVFQSLINGPWMSMTGNKKLGSITAHASQKDLMFLKGLIEKGKIISVIDRRYPLSQAAEALRYLGEGHARGKVIINVIESS